MNGEWKRGSSRDSPSIFLRGIMKIIVVSRGDSRRWHTLSLLHKENIRCIVVTHTEEVAKRVKKAFPEFDVRHTKGTTKLLVEKRNWILDNLVDENEWFVGMDDNISRFTMVRKPWRLSQKNEVTGKPPKGFDTWRRVYNMKVSVRTWLKEFKKDIEIADNESINFVGVSPRENPFFRPSRFSNYKIINSKVFALKNKKGLRFKNRYSHDAWISILCVAKYGKILFDAYLSRVAKTYEIGGLGSRKKREKNGLLTCMQDAVEKFPGFVRIGKGENSSLNFRFHNKKSVDRWRKEHGYLRGSIV